MVDLNDPQPGYYKRRLAKGGVEVPARIWWEWGDRETCAACGGLMGNIHVGPCRECDGEGTVLMSDDILRCTINGEDRDPFEEWSWLAGHPITEAEYKYLMADAEHAREYRPDDPKANPRKPVDLDKMKPLF